MNSKALIKELSWEEIRPHSKKVRDYAILQFIQTFDQIKNRCGDAMKWGDEIEYILVKFDDKNKTARVSLRAHELLPTLIEKELSDLKGTKTIWQPECAKYMLEGIPGEPYSNEIQNIIKVEANLKYRRKQITKLLHPDESILSISNFPRLGTTAFTSPVCYPETNEKFLYGNSIYFPDSAISQFPRYKSVMQNVHQRRNKKVEINLKVYQDKCTKLPIEGSPPGKPDVVHLDSTGFGISCCSLQLTYQAYNLNEARILFDNLGVLCPILLALTAASPIFRGFLTESDCRWNVLRDGMDCRTAEERSESDEKGKVRSPFESINCFISKDGEKYNDIPVAYDAVHYQQLCNSGVDYMLAKYIANLCNRDPIVLMSGKVEKIDIEDTYHIENMICSNWQSIRLKLAEPDTSNGWRVEVRPCEVQLTDFDNAAFACFVTLLTRVILAYDLNFLLPISKIDENMEIAQKRDACRSGKFWFRKNLTSNVKSKTTTVDDPEYELMTIDEIINGKESFPGIVSFVKSYLFSNDLNSDTHSKILKYLQLIQNRAAGKTLTTATWLRQEVLSHADYKQDSIVTDQINYDLMNKIKDIQSAKYSLTVMKILENLQNEMQCLQIDDNMENAQKRNACRSEQFWFRKTMTEQMKIKKPTVEESEYELMTINEIIDGTELFPGIVPIIQTYHLSKDINSYTHAKILQYLQFIQNRASGKILTEATWLFNEVLSHPDYKNDSDSIVTDRINYDLLNKIRKIQCEQFPF